MKEGLHNHNFGFYQLKRSVHFDSTDHDCPEEPPRSEWAPNHARAPIAQDSSKGNQCTRRSKHSTSRIWRTLNQLITRKLSQNILFRSVENKG